MAQPTSPEHEVQLKNNQACCEKHFETAISHLMSSGSITSSSAILVTNNNLSTTKQYFSARSG